MLFCWSSGTPRVGRTASLIVGALSLVKAEFLWLAVASLGVCLEINQSTFRGTPVFLCGSHELIMQNCDYGDATGNDG